MHDTQKEDFVSPLDQYNQELLSQVHPSGWVNPKPASKYNLVVIGGGTAGLVTAARSRRPVSKPHQTRTASRNTMHETKARIARRNVRRRRRSAASAICSSDCGFA